MMNLEDAHMDHMINEADPDEIAALTAELNALNKSLLGRGRSKNQKESKSSRATSSSRSPRLVEGAHRMLDDDFDVTLLDEGLRAIEAASRLEPG